jgi:hypothetical protein
MAITITSPTMTKWFCRTIEAINKCKGVFSLRVLSLIGCSAFEKFIKVMERVLFVAFTCIIAFGMLHFVFLLYIYMLIIFIYVTENNVL